MTDTEDLVSKYGLKRPATASPEPQVGPDENLVERYRLQRPPQMGSEVEGPPMPTSEQMPRDYGDAVKSGLMKGAAAIPGQFGDVQQFVGGLPSDIGNVGLQAIENLRGYFNIPPSDNYNRTISEARDVLGRMKQTGENLRDYNVLNLAYQTLMPQSAKEYMKERFGVKKLVAPTTEEISGAVQPYAEKAFGIGPEYKPRTPEEKLAQEAASLGTQAIAGPGGLLKRVFTGASAGAGGEYARQAAEGTPFEVPAQIAGTILGGAAPSSIKGAAEVAFTPKAPATKALGDVTKNYNIESAYPTRVMAENFDLKEIAENIPQRMRDFTKQITGVKEDLPPLQELVDRAGRAERNRVYTIAQSNPAAQALDNNLFSDLTSRPTFREAMEQAKISAKDNPEWGIAIPAKDAAGNLQYWDQVKKEIDSMLNSAYRSNEPNKASRISSLTDMKTRLEGILDKTVKDYPAARDVASNTFTASNAAEAGMKFMSNIDVFDRAKIGKAIEQYNPDQRKLFNVGIMQTINEAVDKGQLEKLSQAFLKDKIFQDKIRTAMGDTSFDTLRGKILTENMLNKAWQRQQQFGMKNAASRNTSPLVSGGLATLSTGAALEYQMGLQFLQSIGVSPTTAAIALASGAASTGAKAIKNAADRRIVGEMINLISKNDPKTYLRINELTNKHPDLYKAIIAPGLVTQLEEDREGRATGGKVTGSIAQRLVAAADKAHKYHQKTTEEILDTPDEHVVKALAVANKHI